jgi:hypothetical protein
VPVATIDSLFDELAEYCTTEIQWLNGFGCDLMVSYSTFDPDFGYPQKIILRQESANPMNIGLLRYMSIKFSNTRNFCFANGWARAAWILESFAALS